MTGGAETRAILREAARLAAIGLPVALLVSLGLGYALLAVGSLDSFWRGLVAAVALPLILVPPLLVWVAAERAQVRAARRAIVVASSRDQATGFLSGPALAGLIEDRRAQRGEGPGPGAFLIVDAATLDGINRRYGFAWREDALGHVADAIRSSVRAGDLVARIGTDRFGVFLPGAGAVEALDVGERIRASAAARYFAPEGVENMLDVVVGGAAADAPASLRDLYALAAETLDDPRARASTRIRTLPAPPAA